MQDNEMKQELLNFTGGKINRRQFVTTLVSAGIALPSALSLSNAVLAATPKKGGRLRQGFSAGSTSETLDVLRSTGAVVEITNNWCWGSNLTEVLPDGSIAPELAESIESTPDAQTWMFRLRKDIEFHNGKSLIPEDVIHSLNRHRGEDSESALKSLFTSVKDIRKDDRTVVFELDSPNADFPFILSDYHAGIMASDDDGNVDTTSGIGTGPYILQNFDPGVRSFFKRNPNYFKSDRAYFDEVENLVLTDSAARNSALLTGEVDVIDNVQAKTASKLDQVEGIRVQEVTGTQHRTMVMRLDTKPFDNFDLRMALKLAVNRQEIVDKVEYGHGVIGNDHHISPTQQYYNSELPQREYDPDKAKYHLKKAGMEGVNIELITSPAALDGAEDAGVLFQASAKPVGINVDVKRVPADGFWSNVWNQQGNGFVTSYWNGRPTNDWMLSSCCTVESEWNDTVWRDTQAADKFNKLVVAARSELDTNKRKDMYWECQRLLHEDGGVIVWGFTNYLHGLSSKVMHPEKVAGNWNLDGCKSAERWWFA